MKKLLLLTTGGTIAARSTDEGLTPSIDGKYMAKYIAGLDSLYEISIKDIMLLDSSNIQPEEWQDIAVCIFKEMNNYDGIVISHGTDTMAYTASILSFMLINIKLPVVLTGAQLPIENPLSDGPDNLRVAFAMAASGRAGIYIAFDRKIILGCRAVKTHTIDFAAFESVNYPYIATVGGNGLNINESALPIFNGECRLCERLETGVFLIKLTPGLNPEIFDMLLKMHYKGVVIEAFGAGGIHFIRRDLITKLHKAAHAGMTVVVCSQCLYEKSDFTLYQAGMLALGDGVIEGHDMTTEAAVTKLMWVLGQTDDKDEIRKLFLKNVSGEVN